MGYVKKRCAMDFVNAFEDGRISWKLYDYEALYSPQERFHFNISKIYSLYKNVKDIF